MGAAYDKERGCPPYAWDGTNRTDITMATSRRRIGDSRHVDKGATMSFTDWLVEHAGTYNRQDTSGEPSEKLYVESYLIIRVVVGALGILLPVVLWVIDDLYLQGGATARGSLSAYYNTHARDAFVGVLCMIGILLVTYMGAIIRSVDFWLSTLAGLCVIGVAFVPTAPDRRSTEPLAPMQRQFGVSECDHVHFMFAAAALVSLGLIAIAFGWREWHWASHFSAYIHFTCAGVIALALLICLIGRSQSIPVIPLAPTYTGEVMTIWSFGFGWLYKAWTVWQDLKKMP
jgi:hypothetical protein